MKAISILIVLFFLAAGAWFLFFCDREQCAFFDFQKARFADSFEKCAALGFPVMESHPRQCRAGETLFVETLAPSNDMVRLIAPLPNSEIVSPLTVKGEARGNWYFEASFPVRLFDGNGKEIAVVPAQAKGEWMTTEFVPFEVVLTFETPLTDTGMLVLEKDNPSGLPEHAASVGYPIRFSR